MQSPASGAGGLSSTGQGPATGASAAKKATSEPVLSLGLELMVAFIVIIIAGASPQSGKLVVIFLFGLLCVFLIAHPQVLTHFSDLVSSLNPGPIK
jgi:hypothetical protein